MQIATWNVNSIRTRLEQVQDWLTTSQADLICLQETKVEDSIFPRKPFESNGHKVYVFGQKAYNGVALISSCELEDVRKGFSGELKQEGEKDVNVIAKAAGIGNPKRIYILRKQVKSQSPRVFLQLLSQLLEIEAAIKNGLGPKEAFRDGFLSTI